MIEAAVNLVLGLLALAVTAGWFSTSPTRQLRRLKAEADLLPLLPKSRDRDLLQQRVHVTLHAYLHPPTPTEVTYIRRQMAVLTVLLTVVGTIAVTAGDKLLWELAPPVIVLFLVTWTATMVMLSRMLFLALRRIRSGRR